MPVAMQASTRSLDFARDDRGWGGLKVRGQNPHSDFAKGAKSGWGSRRGASGAELLLGWAGCDILRLRSGQALPGLWSRRVVNREKLHGITVW